MSKKSLSWKIIILLQTAIILVFLVVVLLSPCSQVEILANMMSAEAGVLDESGWFIDENSFYQGYFTSTPAVTLPFGSYTVDIFYRNTSNYNLIDCVPLNEAQIVKADRLFPIPQKNGVLKTEVQVLSSSAQICIKSFYQVGGLSIEKITIRENHALGLEAVLFAILLFLFLDLIIWNWKKQDRKARLGVLALVCCGIFLASIPLFSELAYGHDLEFHITRIEGLREGLLSGQFPVRIHPFELNGFGYATSLFYPELLLYIPAFLRILNFPVIFVWKLMLFLINAGTAAIAYFSFKEVFKNRSIAAMGSFLYVTANFHFVNMYLRAALGETLAMMFFPLIVAALYDMIIAPIDTIAFRRGFLLGILGYSGVIQSHLISCVVVGLFTLLFCFLSIKRIFIQARFKQLLKTVLLTAAVNLWFLLPLLQTMLTGTYKVEADAALIQTHGAYLKQIVLDILSSGAGISLEAGIMSKEMSFCLGLPLLVGIAAGLIILLWCLHKKQSIKWAGSLITLVFVSIWMSTLYFPYNFLQIYGGALGKLFTMIQFPWRFLTIASCFCVLWICFGLSKLGQLLYKGSVLKATYRSLATLFILTSIFTVVVYQSGDYGEKYTVLSASSVNSSSIGNCEYLPEGSNRNLLLETSPSGNLKIEHFEKDALSMKTTVSNPSDTTQLMTMPVLNYPGYVAYDGNQNRLSLQKGFNGQLAVEIPAGYSGDVFVLFQQKISWNISSILSLLFVLALMIYWRKPYALRSLTLRKKSASS